MPEKSVLNPKKLSPEARMIVKNKGIKAKKSINKWVRLFKELAAFDQNLEIVRKKCRKKAVISAVVIFAGLFITIFGSAATDGNPVFFIVCCSVLLAAVMATVFYGIKTSRLSKIDLANDFRITLLPLLEMLKEDIAPQGRVLLDLDMKLGTEKACRTSSQKIDPGRFKKLVETIYDTRACHAVFPLVNGTKLHLSIARRYFAYKRFYRSSSGKYKSKIKWKLLTTVATEVHPPQNRLDLNSEKVSKLQKEEKIQLKEKSGHQVCRLIRRFKFKSPDGRTPDNCVEPEKIVDMYMQLCSALEKY